MKPVKLSKSKLNEVLEAFKPDTISYRVVEHLGKNPRSPVSEVNTICSAGNISDVALKYNSTLRPFGLAIGCSPAPVCYFNQYHQPSAMYEWSLMQLSREELKLPIKGPNRPQAEDPAFKKRQKIIIDRTKEGEFLNAAIKATRNIGLSRASV